MEIPGTLALALRRAFRAMRYAAPLALLFSLGHTCSAQDGDPTFTLQVYTNLLQIPVVIRSPHLDYVPKVDPNRLTVTVDHGEPFRPAHVRPEGDDPLALAILLDIGNGNNELLPVFTKKFVTASTRSLHTEDNVAIYSLNCTLSLALAFAPADATQLKLAAGRATDATRHPQACEHPLHLRDSIALITGDFARQRGRRVLLILSDGHDAESKITAAQLRLATTDAGVAIFGLAPVRTGQVELQTAIQSMNATFQGAYPIDQDFDLLCKDSGGLARLVSPDTLTTAITGVVKTLRERFIIEFPWPKTTTTAGSHIIAVALAKSDAYIHTAGISFSIPESHILEQLNTIHAGNAAPPAPSASDTPPSQ